MPARNKIGIDSSSGPGTKGKMSAPTQKKAKKIGGGQLDLTETEAYFLFKGGKVEWEYLSKLTHVRIDPQVTCIPNGAFSCCSNVTELQLNEGLLKIGAGAFAGCTALRRVTIPPTVTTYG